MGVYLHFEYDIVEKAIDQIMAAKADLEEKTGTLNNAVGQLGTSFKGKAARKFLDGWNGNGKRYSQKMITLLDKDWKRLGRIYNMVRESDAATAALFVEE